jgi:hypothetical protein
MQYSLCVKITNTVLPGYNAVIYTADRVYRGSFLFPVSFKEIPRKNMEVAAANLALQEAFPLK